MADIEQFKENSTAQNAYPVRVFPALIVCDLCGYAMRAGELNKGDKYAVVFCMTSSCKAYEKRLLLPGTLLHLMEADYGR